MSPIANKDNAAPAPQIRTISFIALFALWLLIVLTGLAFLALLGAAIFVWSWDGPSFLAMSLLPLGLCIAGVWAALKLTRSGRFLRSRGVS